MKTIKGNEGRLLAIIGMLALLPLAIWACGDAGSGPGAPTGEVTKYNPQMDVPGATLTAFAGNSSPAPGETFGIGATFRDAFGNLVEGAPIHIWTEFYGAAPRFTFNTNPTLTDASGMASIKVTVPADCPNDSYTFVVSTHPGVEGPYARAYVHIRVSGAGSSDVTAITLITDDADNAINLGESVNYIATATATANCAVRMQYQRSGGSSWEPGTPSSVNPWMFSLTPGTPGSFTVFARAFCDGSAEYIVSDPVTVTVTGPSLTTVTLAASPTTVTAGSAVSFTITTNASGCTPDFEYQASGGGLSIPWTPTSSSFSLTPTLASPDLTVTARGECILEGLGPITSNSVTVTVN